MRSKPTQRCRALEVEECWTVKKKRTMQNEKKNYDLGQEM